MVAIMTQAMLHVWLVYIVINLVPIYFFPEEENEMRMMKKLKEKERNMSGKWIRRDGRKNEEVDGEEGIKSGTRDRTREG